MTSNNITACGVLHTKSLPPAQTVYELQKHHDKAGLDASSKADYEEDKLGGRQKDILHETKRGDWNSKFRI